MPNNSATTIWQSVLEAGADFNIQACGLASRDTLRLEMGFCLYGNDIDDATSPIEAGLGWITKFTKDFVNAENLKKQKEEGITKKLVGFEMQKRAIPRKDYPIVDAMGTIIGRVTSGTMSPSLGKGIGMGYVSKDFWKQDSEIFIEIRSKKIPAKVVKLPFYKG
jgi:aminomethyltransferase